MNIAEQIQLLFDYNAAMMNADIFILDCEAQSAKLPTRDTESLGWGYGGRGYADRAAHDYAIKLSNAKANAVYWKYFDYHIAHPPVNAVSDAQIRQNAHHSAKIAIAYLECRCHHCRFASRKSCPEGPLHVAFFYKAEYPEEYRMEYGNSEAFLARSPCLIMAAMREKRRVMATLYH